MTNQESYTAYCTIADWQIVLSIACEMPDWQISPAESMQIDIITLDGNLKVTALLPEIGGKFGPIYAGTINRVKRVSPCDQKIKHDLIEKLKGTNFIIGFVASPEFSDNDSRFEYIFSVANQLSGIIFDSFTFVSQDKSIILSLE